MLPAGPTLNPEYNGLLAKWAKECVCRKVPCTCGAKDGTRVCKPECEECGFDLTGRHVYCDRLSWVGDCCSTEAYWQDEMEEREIDVALGRRPARTRSREDGYEDFHADG